MNLQRNRIMEIDKLLKGLTPIVERWMDLIEEYSSKMKNKDALYWYNERATLSTFAGAIWLSRGIALEEFSSTKIKSTRGKSTKTKSGRTDLWFYFNGKEYIVEAKQISPSMHYSEKDIIDQLQNTLEKEACNDAAEFSPPKFHKKCLRIGVVFLTPYLPKSYKNKHEIKSKILALKKKIKERLKGKRDYHLLAIPSSDSSLKLQDTSDGLIYPIVVLVAKVVRIKKRDMKK